MIKDLSSFALPECPRPIAAVKRAELQQLLVEVEDGNGDGAQG